VKSRQVVPRELAERDTQDAITRYIDEGGADLALRFIDALEAAYRHIAANPASGSPRYAQELDLPELRFWAVKRFPYLIFYVEHEDHIDVWRILHGQRDIPAWLQQPQ
jgi:toxin ParE1/3/4